MKTTKTCRKCGVEKPVTEFYRHRRCPTGIGVCKPCHIARCVANEKARRKVLTSPKG